MPRPSRIVQLGLEETVLRAREAGKTLPEMAAACNAKLGREKGAQPPTGGWISTKAISRYLATLDAATVPVAHQPQVAEENAQRVINVGEQIAMLNEKLLGWLDEATGAMRTAVDDNGTVIDLGPDWTARLGVARELREHTKFYADVLERIYNAEQVQMFQEEVMRAIREADPATAHKIEAAMRERQSIRRAALLGAA